MYASAVLSVAMQTNASHTVAPGIGSVQGASTAADSGTKTSVLAVTWPVATLSGDSPRNRRPMMLAKA